MPSRSTPLPLALCAAALLLAGPASAARVVAIGDIHGDVGKLRAALVAARLIDASDNWIGGDAELVQTGDLVDRGPTSRQALELMMKLEREAGDKVHVLTGNHEVLDVLGDLRYVSPEEFGSYLTLEQGLDQEEWKRVLGEQLLVNGIPEHAQGAALLPLDSMPPEASQVSDGWVPPRLGTTISCVMKASSVWKYRTYWSARERGDLRGVSMDIDRVKFTLRAAPVCPLGYWGHRAAMSPEGHYGKWIAGHDVVTRLGTDLFLHGGISPRFGAMSLSEVNRRARAALVKRDRHEAVLGSDDSGSGPKSGPTWYRCLEPAERVHCKLPGITDVNAAELDLRSGAELTATLQAEGVHRMVMGHTVEPTGAIRSFGGGRVFFIDTGMSIAKGDALPAALELDGDQAFAVYGPSGARIKLPSLPATAPLADYAREQREYLEEVRRLYSPVSKQAQALTAAIARYQLLEPPNGDPEADDENAYAKASEATLSAEQSARGAESEPPLPRGAKRGQ